MSFPVTEHIAKSARYTTFYLACGGAHRPVIIFVHGWPELSISWRYQLPCFASLGFRAIAPDMRGYGHSSVYHNHADYALEPIVQDMLELLDTLGQEEESHITSETALVIIARAGQILPLDLEQVRRRLEEIGR